MYKRQLLDDASVVVQVIGQKARVLGSRVLRHKRSATALPSHELEELEKAAQQAQQEHKRLLQALDRVQRNRQRSSAWLDLWSRALPRAPQPSPQTLEDWKAAIEKIEAQMTEALDRTSELGRALQQAKRAEKQANLRLEAGKRVSPDYRAALEVQIESPADQTIEIEARYRTACALWRPEHLARLQTTPEGELEVEVQTVATAWQATGEVWEGVRCKFSTARPAHAASPPLLSEDLLVSRRKTEQERKYVRVEQRDEQAEPDHPPLKAADRPLVEHLPDVDVCLGHRRIPPDAAAPGPSGKGSPPAASRPRQREAPGCQQ